MRVSGALIRSVAGFCVLAVGAVSFTLLVFPDEGDGQVPAVAALVAVAGIASARLIAIASRGDSETWRPTAPLVSLPPWMTPGRGRPDTSVPDAVGEWEAMLISAETGPARSRARLSARLRESLDLDLSAHLDPAHLDPESQAGPSRAGLLDAVEAALDHQENLRERS